MGSSNTIELGKNNPNIEFRSKKCDLCNNDWIYKIYIAQSGEFYVCQNHLEQATLNNTKVTILE